jgi:outer membrane receptor protein involved in Fe transport
VPSAFCIKTEKMKKILVSIVIVCLSQLALAQKGRISGKVVDGDNGDVIIGASIKVNGQSLGAISDFDGNFTFEIDPGTYDLTFSYISYANKIVTGIIVKPKETTTVNATLEEALKEFQTVVVRAEAKRNTEATILNLQKKSVAVQDGISVEEIKKLGSSNAAQSVKQITGASVEGGKYVVMRGLGDRYSITQLNGIIMPSVDPYRNSSSMDLIPSAMIDNMVVKKTFTPDQPGNFAGGNVDITTKSLPDKFYLDFNTMFTYNSVSSFNKNFQRDAANGKMAWAGFDGGSKDLPEFLSKEENREVLNTSLAYRASVVGNNEDLKLYDEAAKSLNNSYMPVKKASLLDQSYSIAFGDRFGKVDGTAQKKFGYNFSLRFSKNYDYQADLEFKKWERNPSADVLANGLTAAGSNSTLNSNLGGLFSVSYRPTSKSEYSALWLYSHDYSSAVTSYQGYRPEAISNNSHTYYAENLMTTNRNLNNFQIKGRNLIDVNKKETELEYTVGFVNGKQNVPDFRSMVYWTQDAPNGGKDYVISASELSYPFNFFRFLTDNQYSANIDWKLPITKNKNNFLKVGGLYTRKNRKFDEYRFQLSDKGSDLNQQAFTDFTEAGGDFSKFFNVTNRGDLGINPENSSQNLLGYTYASQSALRNFYTGHEQFFATYAMMAYEFTKRWKVVGGSRIETTDIYVVSKDQTLAPGKINKISALPSLGLIFGVKKEVNLRINASRTLARPNMREIAPYTARNPANGQDWTGNPDLKMTNINNFDLRYEFFPKPGELIAVSAFYKQFFNPIVLQIFDNSSSQTIQYANSDKATLYGAEFEFRKGLDFISSKLKNFKFLANFTYIYSRVNMGERELQTVRFLDPTLKEYRPFQAQSPYIINLNLNYSNDSLGLESTLYSNTFGPRLIMNGSGAAPDVYEIRGNIGSKIPVPDLNWTLSKKVNQKFSMNLRIFNILGADYYTYQEYKGTLNTRDYYKVGRSFSIGLKYAIQ